MTLDHAIDKLVETGPTARIPSQAVLDKLAQKIFRANHLLTKRMQEDFEDCLLTDRGSMIDLLQKDQLMLIRRFTNARFYLKCYNNEQYNQHKREGTFNFWNEVDLAEQLIAEIAKGNLADGTGSVDYRVP